MSKSTALDFRSFEGTPLSLREIHIPGNLEKELRARIVEKICSRAVVHIPGANIKEFLGTILGEAAANPTFELGWRVFGTKDRRSKILFSERNGFWATARNVMKRGDKGFSPGKNIFEEQRTTFSEIAKGSLEEGSGRRSGKVQWHFNPGRDPRISRRSASWHFPVRLIIIVRSNSEQWKERCSVSASFLLRNPTPTSPRI